MNTNSEFHVSKSYLDSGRRTATVIAVVGILWLLGSFFARGHHRPFMYIMVFASPALVLFGWAWMQLRSYANALVYSAAVDDLGIRSLDPSHPSSNLSWAEVATLDQFGQDIRVANRALTKTVVLSQQTERYEELLKIVLEKGHFPGYQDKVLPLPNDRLRISESTLQLAGRPALPYSEIGDVGVGYRQAEENRRGGLAVFVQMAGERVFLDSGDIPIPVIYRRVKEAWVKGQAQSPDRQDRASASA